jgi:hypothetical protein
MNILYRCKGWVLTHPNTMTYIAVMSTLNFILNMILVVTGH